MSIINNWASSVKLSDGFERKIAWRELAKQIVAESRGDLDQFELLKAHLMKDPGIYRRTERQDQSIRKYFSDLRAIVRKWHDMPQETQKRFFADELVYSRLAQLAREQEKHNTGWEWESKHGNRFG